jgi:hypothetical protein
MMKFQQGLKVRLILANQEQADTISLVMVNKGIGLLLEHSESSTMWL